MNLSEIFETEPKQWGFRGDPYFWRYLKEKARKMPITISEAELEDWIKKEHREVSGKEMTDCSIVRVEQFAHGGMSSGGISGQWWTEDGIPLLVSRLRANEAKDRWRQTKAYAEYSAKAKNWSKEQTEEINAGLDDIFANFSKCMKAGLNYDSQEAQALVTKLQEYITENFYTCTKDILAGLGQMYTADERFRKNIDRHAEGTADYVGTAISCYCGE
ncbi:MAG: hypothetical protein E7233_11040 [Lachnospiraceae bacterium]|nr:hypothetical protein [Lachnospiraceae bacterium]